MSVSALVRFSTRGGPKLMLPRTGRKIPDLRPALVSATQVGRAAGPLRRYHSFDHVARVFVYEIPISLPSALSRFLMPLTPCQRRERKQAGEVAMSDRRMIDTDDGSKGGRRSVLFFGTVAAALTVMMILIGVSGRHVTPSPQQASTEAPTTSGSPTP